MARDPVVSSPRPMARDPVVSSPNRPGLLEAWLALTSVKYHGNLWVSIPLNQRLALTRLRATGPRMSLRRR